MTKRVGSSKELHATAFPGQVLQVDRGTTSVLDYGSIPEFTSSMIAQARTEQAAVMFELLHRKGIRTHQVSYSPTANQHVVREVQVQNYPLLSVSDPNGTPVMVGLEVLVRTRVSEKFLGRIERGKIDRDQIRLATGETLQVGVKLAVPYVEFSTKWADVDGYLSDEDAMSIGELGPANLRKLKALGVNVGQYVEEFCAKARYTLIDFKIEVAVDTDGEFMVIDALTLDEMGLTKRRAHYGKNLLRQHYEQNERAFYQALRECQAKGDDRSAWPEMPLLPKRVKDTHIARYKEAARDLVEVL